MLIKMDGYDFFMQKHLQSAGAASDGFLHNDSIALCLTTYSIIFSVYGKTIQPSHHRENGV
jgi:hypothetical protein